MVSIVIFIMGRTGSGKSTTARFLAEVAQDLGWSIKTFNDYPILREMYETDTGYRFRRADYDGFEVLDLSVYGLAIQKLAQQLQSYHPENDRTLITVEFTSNNYRDALRLFDETLLRGARFVFLNADLLTCLKRISERVFHRSTADDYHVIEKVLLGHYPNPYMPLHVGKAKAKFIPNMASIDDLRNKVRFLAPALLERPECKPEPISVLNPR
jgi:adenylate kinase family enzyme